MLKQLFASTLLMLSITMSLSAQKTKYALVLADDVKMRLTSSTASTIEGYAQMGEVFEILEISEHKHVEGFEEAHRWFKLRQGSKTGWVYGPFVFEELTNFNTGELEMSYIPDSKMLRIQKFINTPYPCDMGRCVTLILAIYPNKLSSNKKVRLIKLKNTADKRHKGNHEEAPYRGMPNIAYDSKIEAFRLSNEKIILYIKAQWHLFKSSSVYELEWNGTEYIDTLKVHVQNVNY